MNTHRLSREKLRILFACLTIALFAAIGDAQTSQFSYQGSINVSGSPASGPYDFEFRLYDSLANGSQVGSMIPKNGVVVTNGAFSVGLDFLSTSFPGSDRFLEISVRPAGNGGFTTLSPRTQILSTPYAVKASSSDVATNSLTLDGVAANQYVLTSDSRLTDSRTPATGSSNYIQNKTGTPQAGASLTIDGTATAANINASQFYQLNGQRIIFTQGSDSLFVGPNIALNNTGINNTFFGAGAGTANTGGAGNALFGRNAGTANLGGQSNSFFGNGAGGQNQSGSFNVYVGQVAGQANTAGQSNTFIGTNAGASSPTGSNNVAVGADAGNAPTLGSNSTFIGKGANANQPSLTFATAIGSGAVVGTSNTIVIGRSSDTTVFPGPVQMNGGVNGASIPVCATNIGQLGVCASSKRYKSEVLSYRGGLEVVSRLRPVTFTWKGDGIKDVGFVAEEVNAIEPRLSVLNKEGSVEGVKYGQVTAVLVNAVKEQQKQIASQQAAISKLQDELAGLRKVLRSRHKRQLRSK
jgi:hypothetical protein